MAPSEPSERSPSASSGAIRILGISGSLRARSSNTELLQAAALLAPPDVMITLLSGLDALPYFNPDLDEEGALPPPRVAELREQVGRADALLICSPEYAHGVPGVLKNALDWLVSVPDVAYKPVGLFNAAPRASHAHASLVETLRTMSLTVVPAASIAVPVSGRSLSADAIAGDPVLAEVVRGALQSLAGAAVEYRERIRAHSGPEPSPQHDRR